MWAAYRELQRELEEAKAEIERLKQVISALELGGTSEKPF